MNKLLYLLLFPMGFQYTYAQIGNVGINTDTPTNKLHIKGNAITDPLRVENLLPAQNTAGTLVADASGVIRLRNLNSISYVRASGNITLAATDTYYFTNATAAVSSEVDNLNEFSGNTFTVTQTGLYLVTLTVQYTQQNTGDGYLGHSVILKNGVIVENNVAKIAITEVSGAPSVNGSEATAILKLNTADTISFQARSYGAGASTTAIYNINIVRLD